MQHVASSQGSAPHPAIVAGALAALDAGEVRLEFVHPLTRAITTVTAPHGVTIAELLKAAGVDYRRWGGGKCWVEDAERLKAPQTVPLEFLARCRPKAGTVTTVMLWPGGGGGQAGGKSILRVVLMLAVAAVAFMLAPEIAGLAFAKTSSWFGVATALAGGVIPVTGPMALNATEPPARARA